MSDLASRRAGAFRHRAHQLTEAASHEWRDEERRRHLLELAAQYQRAADTLFPREPCSGNSADPSIRIGGRLGIAELPVNLTEGPAPGFKSTNVRPGQ
jgi:hypothetical protein